MTLASETELHDCLLNRLAGELGVSEVKYATDLHTLMDGYGTGREKEGGVERGSAGKEGSWFVAGEM